MAEAHKYRLTRIGYCMISGRTTHLFYGLGNILIPNLCQTSTYNLRFYLNLELLEDHQKLSFKKSLKY